LADVTDDYIGYSPEVSRYLHDICAAMIGMNRYPCTLVGVPTVQTRRCSDSSMR
jgi:hypothetical protein